MLVAQPQEETNITEQALDIMTKFRFYHTSKEEIAKQVLYKPKVISKLM